MSSSTTGIPFRSRSLRKPASNNNNNTSPSVSSGGVTDGAANVRDGGGARTLSPTRLPVKGSSSLSITRSTSTRVASTSKSSGAVPPSPTAATAPKKTRPLSAVLGRSRAESAPQKEADGGSTRDVLNSRPPRTATTRPPISGTARPPSSSGGGPSTRSTSMARPTSSSGVPSGSSSSSSNSRLVRAPTSGHARTKSSITSLTGATTLRPPSQTSVDSGGSSSNGVAAAAAPDRSRPPITRSAAAAAHRRNISASSAVTTTSSVSARPRQATVSSARQAPPLADPVSTADNPPPHRPAFSTLQQHYSPAKSLAPKPLTSTYLAPPSPSKLPSNVALSAEISRLQTELLQLHLLHRDAHAVTGQWRSSAKHKLGDRFANTVKLDQQVSKIEESVVETKNLRALVDWGSSHGGGGLESKIQMLDEIVCGLWALGESGGRYTRVVRRFEKWASRVREVSEARKLFDRVRAGEGDGQQVTNELLGNEGLADLLLLSAEETGGAKVLLDAEWKEECAMLVRRLTEWRRMLKGLVVSEEEELDDTTAATKNGTTVVATESSSLARILRACRSLVHDMLAELDLMEQMEHDAVAAENAWVRAVNRDEDEHGEILPLRRGGSNNTRAGAIWRAF
ncbi:hypothetical protein V8F33_005460 [Rhypophila sp. PSN 637]